MMLLTKRSSPLLGSMGLPSSTNFTPWLAQTWRKAIHSPESLVMRLESEAMTRSTAPLLISLTMYW
jgi:hypothetical protein